MKKSKNLKYQIIFLAPFILMTTIFVVYPLIQVIINSFFQIDNFQLTGFIGFDNYIELFGSSTFWTVLMNNFYFLIIGVPLWTIFPLVIAVLLQEKVIGYKFFKSAYFLPSVLATTVIGLLFKAFLAYNGPINTALESMGLGFLALDWLGSGITSIPIIAFVINWAGFGGATLIILAGMSNIDESVYEAANLDGVTWFQRLWHITIPMIKGTIGFVVTLNIIYAFTSLFNYIYVMTSGGPGYESTVIEYLLYREAFSPGRAGYASSIAVVMIVIVVIINFIVKRAFKED